MTSFSDLAGGGIDVWTVTLDAPATQVGRLQAVLSADERSRAARFVFDRDRVRFIVAHGFVRILLGQYLGVNAANVRFAAGPYGKPYLPDAPRLRFNLSHADRTGVVAVTQRGEVGVDVEHMRPEFATMDVARRFFAPAEVAVLESLEGAARVQAFFACWTRKEAYIKALGLGLSLDLDSFSVSIAAGEPPRLLHAAGGADELERWRFHAFEISPEFVAALAVEGDGPEPTIRSHQDLAIEPFTRES